MNKSNSQKTSETNWERIEKMTDNDIDTSDLPPLDDNFFANATLRMPKKKISVTLEIDQDVWEWFVSQGEECQTEINTALKMYATQTKNQHNS
ncbi:MAG: BrnA antitoxin family protein [Crocosphaera sp.]|jgi:uncharacterized protein (DUF4415 family)